MSAIAVSGLLALSGGAALAEEELIGAEEYANSCLACHGVGGRGNGPMSEYLTVAPTDLTQISAENDGTFPILEVFQIIDGRSMVGAHGIRGEGGWEMPVWGSRYRKDAGDEFGPYGAEAVIRARVLELVFYLQMIQDS